jgi:outer membrane protein assembly factor BamA
MNIHVFKRILTATAASLFFLLMLSCSTVKHIPEGQFLLDRVSLRTDSAGIPTAELMEFVKQKPNDPKLGLMIYNIVNNDSNRFKRTIRRIGEPPVIYNHNLVNQSITELSIEMKNLGFLNANVYADVDTIGKRVAVNYRIHEGIPYRIRDYAIHFPDSQMNDLARGARLGRNWLMRLVRPDSDEPSADSVVNRQRNPNRNPQQRRRNIPAFASSVIQSGDIFSMNRLQEERMRISNILRNQGYYDLTIDNLHYLADTTLNSNQVDLQLILRDTTLTNIYRIATVKVFSGYDPLENEDYTVVDSVERRDIQIYYNDLHFLRPRVIVEKVTIRPGGLFRERATESTFRAFQALNSISRVNIVYRERNYPDSTLLDCEIYLTPGNIHSFRTRLGGTNNAGDLGIALDVNYGHQNTFNGSEIFNIQLKAAYEFVSGRSESYSINPNYYEVGIVPSLTFSKPHLLFLHEYLQNNYNSQTQYSLGLNIQNRPEYVRNFFNFRWQIRWAHRNNRLTHAVNLLDINYVSMPWKSERFQQYLNTEIDPLARLSYSDVFTAGVGYNLVYTNFHKGVIRPHVYTLRFNAESSGNALRGIFSLANAAKNEAGQYKIGGNPFAQYLKGIIDFSETIPLGATHNIAYRSAFGLAYPYNNSIILPFEKRFFAGGPNSVRGWRTRYLGPGSFNQGMPGDPTTHIGDIYFILSSEYRYKALRWLEPAFFIDCGNIWTIKDYEGQPGGFFRWNKFYKELAVGTGIGLRFDFNFFIFRVDAGTRVYDPALPEGERFMFLKKNFWNNSAAYVAIGYPF